ncbi:hypothetical protein LOK49_LG05G00548 [Camellia lanceoleosa]|uniref:Uncharacterized protein n=1 Tax=Camellia lanceoleosa TaxID=1840588 RepID=A0ACC0HRF3_9ERIC|nr:hypothetical protein LOK49_LG05G00548 [Camellia lanceoleosa]
MHVSIAPVIHEWTYDAICHDLLNMEGNKYVHEVYGEYVSGSVNDEQMKNVVRNSCPGAGACGGMYTANTMASAIEAMGMSLPYSSSTPAEDPLKLDECRLAGKYILDLINPC